VTTESLLVGIAALGVTAAMVPVCIVIAHRWDVMDRPGQLKTQEAPVPYLGGIAVFAGLTIGVCVGRPIALVPLAVALTAGVSDDRFDLPAPARLVAQLGVGAVIGVTQPVHLPVWIGIPLVMAATVVLINGFNFLDGLDMLAAGVGAAASASFAFVLFGSGRLAAASLAGALVAFLLYNRPPARIYLGDGGSYLVGTSMAILLTYAWGVGVPPETGVLTLALVVVPVAEVACAVVRRRRSGRSLLAGDRAHPYDLLVAQGWTRVAASVSYIALEVAVAIVVVVVRHGSMPVAIGIDLVVTLAALGGAALVGGLNDPTGASA
jgi:UDP-GlcNAc:undecaprenyl-phosphate/decaprenyl-phosphate GlcNAc-1-phosphate transferase